MTSGTIGKLATHAVVKLGGPSTGPAKVPGVGSGNRAEASPPVCSAAGALQLVGRCELCPQASSTSGQQWAMPGAILWAKEVRGAGP